LFGATGDLARRKLLPGLIHLHQAGLLPECQIVGTSLDMLDDEGFRCFARGACDEFARHDIPEDQLRDFEQRLTYVPQHAGAEALAQAVDRAERVLGGEPRRLHYLSIPPAAAGPVVQLLGAAGLVDRARIVMEKPFGTNLLSAQALNKNNETFLHLAETRLKQARTEAVSDIDARKKAIAEARKLGEPASQKPAGVVSTVKKIYPKKRRPK